MKITCQACAAKYTIADEKVLGKVVKIRCKKCGATIVVNGNDPAAVAGSAGAHAAPAYDYAQQGAGGDSWTVNVADGDQRTMTDQEVADAYHAGVVTDETFCWKDGMNDWLPLREIEPLYAACTSTRAMPPPQEMPAAARRSDAPTRIQDTGGLMYGSAPAPAPYAPQMAAPPMADAGNGGGGGMFADASPVAARRAGGRAATADLFSGAAQAGSEEDVMTSAPAGFPQAHHEEQKLTGARNENSVLFSLNALTSKGPGPGGGAPMQATSEASGLIDIKQLGAQIGLGQEKKRSAVDDIMNLAGGGAFSPSLSAPVLSAPPIEEYAPQPEGAAALPGPAPRNKLVLFGAVGAGLVVIALAVGAASLLMRGKDDTADKDKAAASASAAAAMDSASASAATDTPAPSASVAATDTAASSAQSPTPPSNNNTGSTGSKSTTSAPATPKPAATVAAAAPAPTQQVLPDVPAAPPPAPVAAAPAQDQAFNMGAAKASLGAIAGAVQGCKRGDATGSGRVVVTFAPSGAVQSAVVTDPPFAGTPTGSCVASRFRSAHVPAFTGSPFEVAKHFTIN